MQPACAADLLQFAPQSRHTITDHPAIRLNLGFPRPTQKAKAAALPFKVCPTAHQAASLIIKMGQFNLKPPLSRAGAFAKYFKDQAGAINNLALQTFFKVALLYRGERAIDDNQICFTQDAGCFDIGNLTFAKQRSGTRLSDWYGKTISDNQANRQSQTFGLSEARIGIAPLPAEGWTYDDSPLSAGNFTG
jgi:hypothetical protein